MLRFDLLLQTVLSKVAWEVSNMSSPLEDEEMLHELVEEVAIVRYNNKDSLEGAKVALQYTQRRNV